MRKYTIALLLPAMLLACGPALSAATPTPSFTISATSTTLSSSGNGSIAIVLTSVDGYAGQLGIACAPPNVPAGTLLPYCGGGPAIAITLTANSTAKSAVGLTTGAVPLAASHLNLPSHGTDASWAFAAAFLLGFGFRRRTRWLSMLLLSVGMLAGFASLTACGGGGQKTLTPGTYAYTLTATDVSTNATASTTAKVTVPPGIPVNSM